MTVEKMEEERGRAVEVVVEVKEEEE